MYLIHLPVLIFKCFILLFLEVPSFKTLDYKKHQKHRTTAAMKTTTSEISKTTDDISEYEISRDNLTSNEKHNKTHLLRNGKKHQRRLKNNSTTLLSKLHKQLIEIPPGNFFYFHL
jgi:hypothetical protein